MDLPCQYYMLFKDKNGFTLIIPYIRLGWEWFYPDNTIYSLRIRLDPPWWEWMRIDPHLYSLKMRMDPLLYSLRMRMVQPRQNHIFFKDDNGSTLTIYSVSVLQSGNYTCLPSNMHPDSVIVTIQAENKSGGLALQVIQAENRTSKSD